jgi:formate dehydrogenase iron-sulfur subunit
MEAPVSVRELDVAATPPAPGPDEPRGLLGHLLYPFRSPELPDEREPMGFFTDTSVCIGCKACEVACKDWNLLPADGERAWRASYDNTGALSAASWRHVKLVERPGAPLPPAALRDGGEFDIRALLEEPKDMQWHMLSDSCKHCFDAPCQLACPTGAIVHTEFSSVLVQPDICTGCGACVTSCPFGVVAESELDGHAHKCTLCYDRLVDGLAPACAKACPTQSIRFGPLDELRTEAAQRLAVLRERGHGEASLYGAEATASYSALHGFYLLLDEPEAYGLPADPVNPWRHLGGDYLRAAVGLLVALAVVLAAVLESTS